MTPEELRQAIDQTKAKIYALKKQIQEDPDPRGKRILQRQLKELQYLQLWHLDQLG